MKGSFDLDDTLFVSPEKFKTESKLRFPFNKIFRERLRFGTIELMNWLYENEVEVGVYTTSFRSERYIRRLFRCYGIRFDFVINGERHAREVQANKKDPMPSKYPAKYRIDLHIDDDISVKQNGRMYGYRVFLVGEQDDGWNEKIKQEIKGLMEID